MRFVFGSLLLIALLGCAREDTCSVRGAPGAGRCACERGTVQLLGACVSPHVADAYCGKEARFQGGACVFVPCPEPRALDVVRGVCVPALGLAEAAAAQHTTLFPDETLACRDNRPPVIEGSHAVCLPREAGCPRGSRWVARKCVAEATCGPGEVTEAGRCKSVITRGPGRSIVDAGGWLRGAVGPDGGAGSSHFCAPLARRTVALGIESGQTMLARFTVELVFPDNDLSSLYSRITAIDDATARPLPDPGIALVEESSRPLFDALRALGGESNAAAARTTVRCVLRALERPGAMPIDSDAGAP
jgi:hypothetical protein